MVVMATLHIIITTHNARYYPVQVNTMPRSATQHLILIEHMRTNHGAGNPATIASISDATDIPKPTLYDLLRQVAGSDITSTSGIFVHPAIDANGGAKQFYYDPTRVTAEVTNIIGSETVAAPVGTTDSWLIQGTHNTAAMRDILYDANVFITRLNNSGATVGYVLNSIAFKQLPSLVDQLTEIGKRIQDSIHQKSNSVQNNEELYEALMEAFSLIAGFKAYSDAVVSDPNFTEKNVRKMIGNDESIKYQSPIVLKKGS